MKSLLLLTLFFTVMSCGEKSYEQFPAKQQQRMEEELEERQNNSSIILETNKPQDERHMAPDNQNQP